MVSSFNDPEPSKDEGKDHPENLANSETFLRASPQIQQRVADLQKGIDEMQSKWRDGIMQFDGAYQHVHDTNVARMSSWMEQRTRLQRSCEKLRDALDRIMEAKEMCTRMQGEELAALFRIKAKDPKRFARFGDIKGCIRQNIETGEFEPEKCECIAGTENTGCLDAVGNVGNTLSCTHILNYRLPNMPLADFFKDGGACRVNSKEAWNDPIVAKEAFGSTDLKKQSIDQVTNVLSVLPQCIPMSQTTLPSRTNSQGKLASKRCQLDAFLVTVDAKLCE